MSSDHNNLLFETYKIHVDLAERVASLREGTNKLYLGVIPSIVAVSVLLHRIAPDADTKWVLPTLGLLVSLSWIFSLHSVTGRLSAKHAVLVALEEKLPFDFLSQEDIEFRSSKFLRRKHSGLLMPVLFMMLCAIWLVVILVGSLSEEVHA